MPGLLAGPLGHPQTSKRWIPLLTDGTGATRVSGCRALMSCQQRRAACRHKLLTTMNGQCCLHLSGLLATHRSREAAHYHDLTFCLSASNFSLQYRTAPMLTRQAMYIMRRSCRGVCLVQFIPSALEDLCLQVAIQHQIAVQQIAEVCCLCQCLLLL